jgi:hypothetical protein
MHRLSKLSYLLLLVLGGITATGCEIVNPAEELPAYISIQDPEVVIDENTGFATNAGLRNVWLYHGGFLQGTYQIDPSVDTNGRIVPFLQLAQTDFFLDGGIYESGLSSFQIPYPFWDRVTFNWQASVGDTLVITPQFHYIDNSLTESPVDEHFDGGSFDLQPFGSALSNADSTFIRLRTDDVFHGTGGGYVSFGADDRWFEAINITPFQTEQSKNIFAEITYKNSIPFSVGLVYQSIIGTGSQSIVTVSPSSEWNTIYVHMISEVRSIINSHGPATNFWLWLKADGDDKEGFIRLDDIRVIREQ